MKLPRRQFLHLAGCAAATPVLPRIAWAQTYPVRPITVIVPFAAGGSSDVIARIIGEHMSRTLGQQVINENVAGAGGTTGSIRAMRSIADGYTIEIGHMGTHGAAVAYYPNLAYKPDVDFAPIGMIIEQAMMIVARKDFPAKDLKEFVSYVKANAEKLNMATQGSARSIQFWRLAQHGTGRKAHLGAVHRHWPRRQCDAGRPSRLDVQCYSRGRAAGSRRGD